MKFNKYKTIGLISRNMGLDVNGNKVTKLEFYFRDSLGNYELYKTINTNSALAHLTIEEIIETWGTGL